MGVEKMIPLALAVVMAAASVGQLPRFIREVQIAQLKLLKESQASKWGRPLLLPIRHQKARLEAHKGSGRK